MTASEIKGQARTTKASVEESQAGDNGKAKLYGRK